MTSCINHTHVRPSIWIQIQRQIILLLEQIQIQIMMSLYTSIFHIRALLQFETDHFKAENPAMSLNNCCFSLNNWLLWLLLFHIRACCSLGPLGHLVLPFFLSSHSAHAQLVFIYLFTHFAFLMEIYCVLSSWFYYCYYLNRVHHCGPFHVHHGMEWQ